MKILLTGSTGFVGKHLKAQLEKAHSVFCLLRGENAVQAFVHFGPSVVINCAAELDNPEKMVEANLALVQTLLELSRKHDCRFIQIGSSSETGPVEGARAPTTPCNPSNIYEATKLAATNLCIGYTKQWGVDTCIARPFSVYGDGDKPRKMLGALIRSYKYGSQFNCYPGGHDWIHVDDFVDGIVALTDAPKEIVGGQIFHFGTGISTSNSEIIRLFEGAVGKQLNVKYHSEKYRDYDVMDWRADWLTSKLVLDWNPKITIKEGIRRLVVGL
jgi:nucleoside-diphosphate-sugar epimerase